MPINLETPGASNQRTTGKPKKKNGTTGNRPPKASSKKTTGSRPKVKAKAKPVNGPSTNDRTAGSRDGGNLSKPRATGKRPKAKTTGARRRDTGATNAPRRSGLSMRNGIGLVAGSALSFGTDVLITRNLPQEGEKAWKPTTRTWATAGIDALLGLGALFAYSKTGKGRTDGLGRSAVLGFGASSVAFGVVRAIDATVQHFSKKSDDAEKKSDDAEDPTSGGWDDWDDNTVEGFVDEETGEFIPADEVVGMMDDDYDEEDDFDEEDDDFEVSGWNEWDDDYTVDGPSFSMDSVEAESDTLAAEFADFVQRLNLASSRVTSLPNLLDGISARSMLSFVQAFINESQVALAEGNALEAAVLHNRALAAFEEAQTRINTVFQLAAPDMLPSNGATNLPMNAGANAGAAANANSAIANANAAIAKANAIAANLPSTGNAVVDSQIAQSVNSVLQNSNAAVNAATNAVQAVNAGTNAVANAVANAGASNATNGPDELAIPFRTANGTELQVDTPANLQNAVTYDPNTGTRKINGSAVANWARDAAQATNQYLQQTGQVAEATAQKMLALLAQFIARHTDGYGFDLTNSVTANRLLGSRGDGPNDMIPAPTTITLNGRDYRCGNGTMREMVTAFSKMNLI